MNRVRLREHRDLLLDLYGRGKRRLLLLSTHPRASRLHFVDRPPGTGQPPSALLERLRARLEGTRVGTLEQVGGDRIVRIEFTAGGGIVAVLVAELFGPRSEIYLLDPDGKVEARFSGGRRSRLSNGALWVPPEKPRGDPAPPREFGERGEGSYTERLARYHEDLTLSASEERTQAAWLREVRAELKRQRRLERNVASDLESAGVADEFRRKGEMLKAYAYQVSERANSVALPSFEDAEQTVEIELDPSLNAMANADRYFERARRAERSRTHAGERLEIVRTRLKDLEELRTAIGEGIPIPEIVERASGLALAPPAELEEAVSAAPAKKEEKEAVPAMQRALERLGIRPRAHLSAAGQPIFVGRNSRENDTLTMKFARPHDYFFHVSGAPGSHVIACVEKNGDLDPRTRDEAARLALSNSALSKSGRGEVSYLERRHVRKRKGDPAGEVHFTGPRKTIWIELSEDEKS